MTREEFTEFLKGDENRALFIEVAKGLGFESPEDIEGLKRKNRELIADKTRVKNELEEMKKKLDNLEEDRYIDKTDGKATEPDVKTKREVDRLKKELEEAVSRASRVESEYNSTLIESTLTKALEETGFNQHKDLLRQAFLGKAKIEIEGDKRTILISDGEQELPAKDFFKLKSTTDLKQYLDKPVNSGAGAHGFSGTSGAKVMKESDFKNLPSKDRAAFMKDGGKLEE